MEYCDAGRRAEALRYRRVNGTPGLLLRHPLAGTGACSFDIVNGRIRASNPDKLRGFLEHTPH